MGRRYTAPQDQAAGPDDTERPLTVAQADDALFARLHEIRGVVLQARMAAAGVLGPWNPVVILLVRVDNMITQLMDGADFVRIIP